MLQNDEYRRALKNSVIISTSTMVCCLILGSLAAYPLAQVAPAAQEPVASIVVVAIHMLPGIAMIIPVFLLVRQLHLYDTYTALIVVHTAFLLPYTIWMLEDLFRAHPGCAGIGGPDGWLLAAWRALSRHHPDRGAGSGGDGGLRLYRFLE